MTEQAVRAALPEAGRSVVEGELRHALHRAARRRERYGQATGAERVLLLRAAPQWRDDEELTVRTDDGEITAHVRGCPTVLSVLAALSEHRHRAPSAYLVVLTPCEPAELGDSVLAQALDHTVVTINRWDLVADAFSVRRLDPRLTRREYRWLAEALLDAQPAGGWKRVNGPLLSLDSVMQRLAAVRFGKDETEHLDAAAILEWTCDDSRMARFLALGEPERTGLARWLESSIGPVATVVFGLMTAGRAGDAVPFGLAAAELYAPAGDDDRNIQVARVRAEERYFAGRAPGQATLRAFAEAAESLVLRWNDNGHAERARGLCDRAERILVELGADELAARSRVLDTGLDALLSDLARVIAAALPAPRATDVAAADTALEAVGEHRRVGHRSGEVAAAEAAVRLLRWLATEEQAPATVADCARRHVRSWSWVDRATVVVFNADTGRVPQAASAYAALFTEVRARRAELDRAFARQLKAWSAAAAAPDRLLLIEDVLDRIARPVAERAAPLIIVLDGMSAANACALAEEITASRAWTETGRDPDGREPVLTVTPSTTVYCRASLLCGRTATGGQSEERAGFAAFWRGRRSKLFHKAGLGAGPGAVLNEDLREALHTPGTVVGVVLNTIDDALGDDHRVNTPTWRIDQIDYLPQLLAEAESTGRPVVLTSDHGHVLEYGSDIHPATANAARYRSAEPGEGELMLEGPRVLTAGGRITVPWDERIRYLPRRAGYHGGASPAEMVVPVLILLPQQVTPPKGWFTFENPSLHEPAWWNPQPDLPDIAPAPTAPEVAAPDDGLFSMDDLGTLGVRVVRSEVLAAQRRFLRKAPPDEEVAALIDGLAEAGGKLPTAAAAALIGQPPFRMAGYLSAVGRLLNVDGYQVIDESDGGRTVTLDVRLLRLQFLGDG
ncbi:BREX-2 system phosphatase PglZ [Thermomonospora cellulosilytica]|uniref:PglZ domain-containing protein n=1 Tax=Thermomonospora cellulosilytica TaxID=1411118 RepID=A0A7W3R9U2_9ACTN|nr:BREX-2 system phosphatase PglZ [Thermomonospora cellulosilytica]MBA9004994.1 hypothetical protein [Thermomonospora cellulosilytica]